VEWADLRASFGGGCSEFSEVVGCGWRVFRDLSFFSQDLESGDVFFDRIVAHLQGNEVFEDVPWGIVQFEVFFDFGQEGSPWSEVKTGLSGGALEEASFP
jgi:hypothetical protein